MNMHHRLYPLTTFIFVLTCLNLNIFQNDAQAADDNKKLKNGFSWAIEGKYTYDSNVYRAPDDSTYDDYGDSCTPATTSLGLTCVIITTQPEPDAGYSRVISTVKDGTYLELDLKPSYKKQLSINNSLEIKAKINSQTYLDSTQSNADKSKYSIEVGDKIVIRRKKSKQDSIYISFLTGKVNEHYLDRDTGANKTFGSNNIDISDRYIYNFSGVTFKVKMRTTKHKYDFVFKYKNNIYVDVPGIEEMVYDNTYYLLGAKVKIPLKRKMKLHIAYEFYNRTYGRKNNVRRFRLFDDNAPQALDSGKLSDKNSQIARLYDYHRIKLTLRKRHSKQWLSYLDYEYTNRMDQVQGYDDFEKNKIKIRITHDYSSQLKLKYALSLWQRKYPNGKAFDNVASGKTKDYEGEELRMSAILKANRKRNYIVEFRYRNDDSTDLRYDFDRIKFSLGIESES